MFAIFGVRRYLVDSQKLGHTGVMIRYHTALQDYKGISLHWRQSFNIYNDPFHKVRGLIKIWNANMTEVFQSYWLSCIDESISIWFSQFTYPGWMYVPRKLHPSRNEYHFFVVTIVKLRIESI